MNMPFHPPTDQEIERANQAMMQEMNYSNADKMAGLTAHNRVLQCEILCMMAKLASAVEAGIPAALAMEAAVGGAMAFGLQLGMHIGLQRDRESIQ